MNIQPIARRLLLGLLISLPALSMAETAPSNAAQVDIEKLITDLPTKPENHQVIAAYYKAEAEKAKKQIEYHESLKKSYKNATKNLPGSPGSLNTYSGFQRHCDRLISAFETQASEYEQMAKEHEMDATDKR
jgi:Skp family chaperone for outer membrane proteins